MKELLQQLWGQAEDYGHEMSKSLTDEEFWHTSASSDAVLRKFAELVANECAKICDQQGRCGWNDDRKAQARVDAELIREQFEVR